MSSLINQWAEKVAEEAVKDYFNSREFKEQISRHVKWAVQGFDHGFSIKHREEFTRTIAERIHQKSRIPVYLWGYRIWRSRMPVAECAVEAERIVTDFLRDEGIKFGDPRFYWGDGVELADADMDYWEGCP